ncbi:MAG: rod shape-determining protein MreC [bacterium]
MSQKNWIYYAVYFLFAVGLLFFETAWGVAPHYYFQPAVGYINDSYNFTLETVDRLYSGIKSRRSLLQKLDNLRKVEKKYQDLKIKNRQLQADNRLLRRQLTLPEHNFDRLIGARVIQQNLTGWERTIRLNKGYNSGLQADVPVFEARADTWILRGRIQAVAPRVSRVILPTDPRFKIGVKIEGIPDRQFILRGEGHQTLTISQFPEYLSLAGGEKVYTAPASSLSPPRLLIGKVRKIKTASGARSAEEVVVEPAGYNKFPRFLWVLIGNG